MSTETKKFYDDYEKAVKDGGKYSLLAYLKLQKRLRDAPFNNR